MTDAPAKPRKPMGRPRKAPEKGTRRNYMFRMGDAVRDKVIEAAENNSRSMSEEIEIRVAQSFDRDPLEGKFLSLINLLTGNGPNAFKLIMEILLTLGSIQDYKSIDGRRLGTQDWESSEATKAAVREIVRGIADNMTRPKKVVGLLAAMTEGDDPEVKDIVEMRSFAQLLLKARSGDAADLVAEIMRQNAHKNDDDKV